jgi:hypothetical protein
MSQSAEPLTILVVRTGGFAGLRRAWRVAADEASSPAWRALVDACPWDAATIAASQDRAAHGGADRYVWEVTAADGDERHPVTGDESRHAVLGERAVEGPWRELIDAVREGGEVTAPGDTSAQATPDQASSDDTASGDVSD